MAAAASAVAAGAVFHVTLDSDQLELTAARTRMAGSWRIDVRGRCPGFDALC
jgi:hypothetical protein